MNKNNNGFTLVELTVVMIIVGLLVAGAASAFHLWLVQHRLGETKDRIGTIEAALVSYVQENGDLPCAAPRDVDRTDPGYGRETDCAGAVASGTVRVDGRDGRKVRIGAVPVRTLDLPDEYRIDGWHKPFTYAVTEVLASDNPLFDSTLGALFVVDENDAPVITPDGSGLYVVISHGFDDDCASGMDAENCDDDATFRDAQFSTAANSGFFDDFTGYATDVEGSTMSNIDRCNDKGMLFAPDDAAADADGCIYSPSLADMSCPAGEAITGFTGGVAQCAAVGGGGGSCPDGQVWDGTQCVPEQQDGCPAAALPSPSGTDCYVSASQHMGISGSCANLGTCQYQCRSGSWARIFDNCVIP